MTRNTLMDLNDHLFAELERLGDEELTGDALAQEIDRARAVGSVAQQVISNASTVLRALEFSDVKGSEAPLPKMLAGGAE